MVRLSAFLRHATTSVSALEHVGRLLKTRVVDKVLVVTGAGISTPSGLPDFRSDETGLYNDALMSYLMAEHKLGDATDFFDVAVFKKQPAAFFALASRLFPGQYLPNKSHFFVRLLAEQCQLRRWYTQNIDVLERETGIEPDLLIEAHGTFASAKCTKCAAEYDGHEIELTVRRGRVPICKKCNGDGVIKPNIVFFGENLPPSFLKHTVDAADCDLCIVMGTGLEVYPFASVVDRVPSHVPKLLINNTVPPQFHGRNDYIYKGDIIDGVTKLVEICGWESQLETMTNHALKNIAKHREYIHIRRHVNQT